MHLAKIRSQFHIGDKHATFGGEVTAVRLPTRFAGDGISALSVRMLEFNRVHVDLAEAGGDWPHHVLNAWRQRILRLAEPFVHLLASEKYVDVVVEDSRHLRETIARK